MNQRTENRIWRGLVLAAVAGLCIAATGYKAGPKPIAFEIDSAGKYVMLCDDGSLWMDIPFMWEKGIDLRGGSQVVASRWTPIIMTTAKYPDQWPKDWSRPSNWKEEWVTEDPAWNP